MRYDRALDLHINPHRDGVYASAAKQMVPDSAVISVTLYGSQEMRLHDGAEVVDRVVLGANSVFVLNPADDEAYKHSTANVAGSSDRAALVYRWSRTHAWFASEFPYFYADNPCIPEGW
jgi:hypothetical protein